MHGQGELISNTIWENTRPFSTNIDSICVDNKNIAWVYDSISVHMNAWLYLKEVEGYLTICICVQGLKGFFRDRNKENHLLYTCNTSILTFILVPYTGSCISWILTRGGSSQKFTACHFQLQMSLYVNGSLKTLKGCRGGTHWTWFPVWPDRWQSCRSPRPCLPPCSAGWWAGRAGSSA